jgi:hypothetical protein
VKQSQQHAPELRSSWDKNKNEPIKKKRTNWLKKYMGNKMLPMILDPGCW